MSTQRNKMAGGAGSLRAAWAAPARQRSALVAAALLSVALICALAGFAYAEPDATDATREQASNSTADIAAAANSSSSASAAAAQSPTVSLDDSANRVNPQQKPDSSFIYDATIADLDAADPYMDGQTVQITGEIVGDRIVADLDAGHCWLAVQATDGTFAETTAYVTKDQADLVDTYGMYGKRGTIMQLRGTFNLTCKEHEGLSDLHVDHASVVAKGSVSPDDLDAADFLPGGALVVLGALLTLVFYRMRESQR